MNVIQRPQRGGLAVSGRPTFRGDRNLGRLVTPGRLASPRPASPPSWSAQVFAWLLGRSSSLRDDVAYLLRGEADGQITFRSQLHGVKFSPLPGTHPEDLRKIRELLDQNLPAWLLPKYFGGQVLELGLLSTHLVTTAGVNFLVDAFQNTTEVENLKFHAYGTGTNAEATGDTALQTEETTQYNPDNTRPTGSQGEGASANIYRTTATYSPDSGGTRAITEHGIMSQAATGGGTLWDRSVFSAVNLVAAADSLQTQYDLTCSAGG